MKSLISYNIFTQKISGYLFLENDKKDPSFIFNNVRAGWKNGDIVCCIEDDWRNFSSYQLKCMCRENLLPIIEKEINPFGG